MKTKSLKIDRLINTTQINVVLTVELKYNGKSKVQEFDAETVYIEKNVKDNLQKQE